MSLFQYLASDKLLKEIRNPYAEFISINEALKRNIEVDDAIVNGGYFDLDEKNIMIYDSEEHIGEIEIYHDMYYSSEYAKEYSRKNYFSELQWRYTKIRAKQLVDYLKEQLKELDEIEIWSIWLDEHKSANIKSVNIEELSVADLDFLNNGCETPICLIIKK